MTREQAANEYAIKNRDIVRSSDYEIAETAFLAGCEHADKEHRERIAEQAQEIERLKASLKSEVEVNLVFRNCNEVDTERIAELEDQLKEKDEEIERLTSYFEKVHANKVRIVEDAHAKHNPL